MKIILTHIIRNIKEKKGRSLLIILSLMIASIVFILNLTIPNQIIEADKNRMRDSIGTSDLLLASFDSFNIDDIKMNKEKIKSVGVNDLYVIHKDKTLAIYGTDINEASKLNLVENIDLKDNEILISENTAKKYNYKENDIITINIENNYYELLVKKITNNKGLMYFKTLSGVVNNNTYNKLTNNITRGYTSYYIDVLNDENTNSIKDYLKSNNKNIIVEKLIDEEEIKDNNAYTQIILVIIFIMATIMIFFVVNTLNKMIVLERIPVIGTFRSIGASKKKMNFLLILENSIYGLIGGILGAIVSLLINNLSIKLLLGGTSIDSKMPFTNLILGILFTIILEILMSLSAIIKSNKYSIKEIMFEDKNTKSNINMKSSLFSIILIILSLLLYFFTNDTNLLLDLIALVSFWIGIAYFIPLLMSIISKVICKIAKKINNGSLLMAGKNIGHNKLLITSTRLVVISVSIMLVILNVSSAFNKMLDSFSISFGDYDLFVRDISKPYTEYEKLKNINGIEDIDYMYMNTGDYTYNDSIKFDVNPMITGMSKSREDVVELNYKIKDLKDDEVLFDEVLLKNNNLKIGDKIKLNLDNKTLDLTIKGTVDTFYLSIQREGIVVTENCFKENISNIPFQLTIKSNDKENVNELIDQIERELKDPDITIMTVDQFVNSQRQNINTIMSLFYIIISLALVLSFVSIINNQIINFMERTKELAVLNSICMSKKELNKMLLIENITSNFIACIIGFIVSIVSVLLTSKVMNGIKMYITLSFNYYIGFMIIGIVLIILISTVIVPINKLKKINIVESIKYE